MTMFWKILHIIVGIVAPVAYIGYEFELFTGGSALSFMGVIVGVFLAIAVLFQLASLTNDVKSPYAKGLIMGGVILAPMFILLYGFGALEQHLEAIAHALKAIIFANMIAVLPLIGYYKSKENDKIESENES